MEARDIEKFKNTNLRNISSNMYKFLKDNYGKRININKQFDFEDYKDSVRMDLINYHDTYLELGDSHDEELRKAAYEKRVLVSYIDEILENEDVLDSFTIYKIQQFINRVVRKMMENDGNNFVTISKHEKYIEYKDIEIDSTPVIGFITADSLLSYLYREFNLKRIKLNNYKDSLLIYKEHDNRLLFKVGFSLSEDKEMILDHPLKDDSNIFNFVCEKFVADKTPKRVLKRVIKNDDVEDILV